MNKTIDNALQQVVETTFESMAFMFPMEEQDAMPALDAPAIAAVTFTGPFAGRVTLEVSSEMLPELARNMLGLDDEIEPSLDQQHDALKEILNVICGNVLPELAGRKAEFAVNAPTVLDGLDADGDMGRLAASADIALDSGQARIRLYVDAGAVLPSC